MKRKATDTDNRRASPRHRHARLATAVSEIVRAEHSSQTSLCIHSRPFFVAWNGVLVLTYAGFPPPLAALKAALNSDADTLGLRPEQFGSKWPKTTLAALDDSAPPLSLAQLTQLRAACDKHAALLPSSPHRRRVAVRQLSVIEYEQRGLERPRRRTDVPLPAAATTDETAAAEPAAAEVARVNGVLSEWDPLEPYWPRVAAAGSRASSYRHESPAGCTCVAFLDFGDELSEAIRAFRRDVDRLLPGHYAWLEERSRHCTLRALD